MIGHIDHADATVMLRQCHRVLKPGGRVRFATPDLEAVDLNQFETLVVEGECQKPAN
jgi:predicted SAM-dependent methyltransferase